MSSSGGNNGNLNLNRKRSVVAVGTGNAGATTMKKARTAVGVKVKIETPVSNPIAVGVSRTTAGSTSTVDARSGKKRAAPSAEDLKERFIAMFSEPDIVASSAGDGDGGNSTGASGSITNAELKRRFGNTDYTALVPIINQLVQEARLRMSKDRETGELCYSLLSQEIASKFVGLDASARLVYQVIERAGNNGIWTKDIRLQTNIQQQALNKIFKVLEQRKLIKPIRGVSQKAKKLYMLYNLQPSTELTGGVWYGSDLEFDYEFINELRIFVLQCVRKLNGGKGITIQQIRDKMIQANVAKVQLSMKEIEQLLRTLLYDYMIEENGVNDMGDTLYVQAKRVTMSCCEFKWWDILVQDFQYRTIRFEDSVTLPPHEPHYHTA